MYLFGKQIQMTVIEFKISVDQLWNFFFPKEKTKCLNF